MDLINNCQTASNSLSDVGAGTSSNIANGHFYLNYKILQRPHSRMVKAWLAIAKPRKFES